MWKVKIKIYLIKVSLENVTFLNNIRKNTKTNSKFNYKTMNLQEAKQILKTHNAWRRGADVSMVNATELGEAIDLVVSEFEDKSRYVIIDLRNMYFMKNEDGKIIYYDYKEEAIDVCGIYEFENAWVLKLVHNHIEP